MATYTLSELRLSILQYAKMENSSFATPAEINTLIKSEAQELHTLLVGAYEDYAVTSVDTVVTNNRFRISLPANFFKLKGVDMLLSANPDNPVPEEGTPAESARPGGPPITIPAFIDLGASGEWTELTRTTFEERNQRRGYRYRSDKPRSRVQYRLQDNFLYLTPANDCNGTYRIWYIYDITANISNDYTTFSFPENWVEYVKCGVAATLLAEEQSDPSYFMNKKAEMKQMIMQLAQNRDASSPFSMIRTGRRNSYNDDWSDDEIY